MNPPPFTLDIGICTFQRPQVVETLRSIAAMEMPEGVSLRVIVADNDASPSAQITIATLTEELGLTCLYLHAPAQNISIARNAILAAASADFLAFIDDDQLCDAEWLMAMTARMDAEAADVYLGPVVALYPKESKHWLLAGDFHSNRPVFVRGKLRTAYTGNVILRRGSEAFNGLTFDLALGQTGGEDTAFFDAAYRHGVRFTYVPTARIYEPVPTSRATLKWLLARRRRYGHTHAILLLRVGRNRRAHQLLATAKMLFCFAAVVVTALFPVERRRWLLRGMLHRGVVEHLAKAAA